MGVKLREAEALLETSYVKGKKVVTKYQKAAKVARDKQEIAAHARLRVQKISQMLDECETGANSASNVVNTAMTEAKISEKRAIETESRAARAAATAQKDRARAEDETRKEEELERHAGGLHEKMFAMVKKDSYKTGLEAQLKEAERVTKEADHEVDKARKEADRLEKANESYENSGYEEIFSITEKRKQTRAELLADYEKRKNTQEIAEERANELKRQYETSDNLLSDTVKNIRSHVNTTHSQQQQNENALLAVNNARLIRKKAQHILEESRYAQSVVIEKRCIFKRAEEYKMKNDRVIEIPPQLANMTFLHTTKHKYWRKSLKLPSTHVHSFSEGVLEQMTEKNKEELVHNLKRFTSSHLCRSFRSWKDVENSSELNKDPLFQWSLGCQLVSLNYSSYDEQLLKADGRFRRNGSCGYTLKPEFLRSYDAVPERPESWKLNVLCGSCLPTPECKQRNSTGMSFINPFVKINVYGGDFEQRKGEHVTSIIEKNGLNPIFDDRVGFIFKATSPSLAILAFTVWHKTDEDSEELIGGSAIPVSCMREGCRSVPLFDKQNTRAGAFAYACLLVKAKRVTR